MKNRRKGTHAKGERKKQGFWLGFGLFVNIALLLSLFFGEMGVLNAGRLKKVHAGLTSELGTIQKKNKQLRRQLESLQSDPNTIEKLARKELGLVKEGEFVYQFFDSERP